MTINPQAIEAAALVLVDVTGEPRVGRFERTIANAILEAAMPHIREQIAEENRKAKTEARADALTKALTHLNRIAPNGLISKTDALGYLALWAERATYGIQPNGNPYTEET